MAAREPTLSPTPEAPGGRPTLPPAALYERLDEEISRAERYGTKLSCLLVVVDNLEEMAREHGNELSEQALGYVAAALGAEVRRFDRVGRPSEGDLVVVLPGTDDTLGEIVARRLLKRLQAIKVEARGARHPLQITCGLAAWQADMSGEELLDRTRQASRPENGEDQYRPGAIGARREASQAPADE
jgi:diguanylate cyclase (GGDEF)-like protein